MVTDERSPQENRTIIILPLDVEEPAWIRDNEGNLKPVTSLKQWFEALNHPIVVSGLKSLDGDGEREERFVFKSVKEFAPEEIMKKSNIMKEIALFKAENELIQKRVGKLRKIRQLLGE